MPEQKSSTTSRLQREADTAEKRGKALARGALLTTDASRRRRMSLTAVSLLMEADTLRNRAAERKQGFRLRGMFFWFWFIRTGGGRGWRDFPMPHPKLSTPPSKMMT
jgi:hypothetical protein